MNSKKIFDNLNRELMNKLIPDKSSPIFGNSLTNCNDPIFDKSFEEIGTKMLNIWKLSLDEKTYKEIPNEAI